jgi:hypothetical protein
LTVTRSSTVTGLAAGEPVDVKHGTDGTAGCPGRAR